jgi:hypothetical protein
MNQRDIDMLFGTPPEWDMLNDIPMFILPPFSYGDTRKWLKQPDIKPFNGFIVNGERRDI